MVDLRLLLSGGLALATLLAMMTPMTSPASKEASERARRFVADHVARLKPLEREASLAWWNANITGKDEDFEKKIETQNRIDEALADPEKFRELKEIKESGQIDEPILAREINVLYLQYLEKQVDPALLKKIVAKANAVEKAFNVYRAKVDGKEMTDSEVRKVLKESKNSERLQDVWEASKGIGAIVEPDLKELVRLRNDAAHKLGYKNFHALQLYLNEQNTDDLMKLFDELDELTRGPFQAAKAEIDAKLVAACQIPVDQLRPWHYQDPFFQETPAVFAADIDEPYRKADLIKLCRDFYAGIGLPVNDVVAHSDLYEKPGKSPHAFCTDIDRDGDVRVLANIEIGRAHV